MKRSTGSRAHVPTPEVSSGGGSDSDVLVVIGEGYFQTYPLGPRDTVIGRDDGCDLQIDHLALSRRHAVLRVGPPRAIEDLGSTNGTRVAGVARKGGVAAPLRSNDSFHIGPFSFVLVARTGVDDRARSLRDATRVDDPRPHGVSALVRELASSSTSIIILGETGVGKEVLAATLHELSGRIGGVVRINCAALSEALLESELFGHEKGAFTGATAQRAGLLEAAAGGTVFLDEVGELPLSIQAKLLRAIEHREITRLGSTRSIAIDVRFVAATNRDLPTEVEAGRFRRDLFFRLDGMTLVIPPLRERASLIAPLALEFLSAAGPRRGAAPRLDAEALAALEAYPWPGNVRELRAVIERAVLLARGGDVTARHLAFARPATAPQAAAERLAPAGADLDTTHEAERARIIAALTQCAGNQTRAARLLDMPRTTLASKLILYRIPRPRA